MTDIKADEMNMDDRAVPKMNELDSLNGISDEQLTELFKEAIRLDNEMKKVMGTPIAGYDEERNEAYLEYPDGRRKYASEH